MRKHKFEVTVNNRVVFTKDDVSHSAFRDAQKAMEQSLWSQWQTIFSMTEGQRGSVNTVVSWECTMNRRAPKRRPDVISAEKTRRAVKGQQQREAKEKWKKESEQRLIHLRQRIKHQVDHAFATGKSGTEPASKYITCEHCNAPAEVVCVSSALVRAVSVLDEDTITGALCSKHSHHTYGIVEKLPCARLEFFYDGIRQIAIKP
jgi:hypothetical protein